MQDYPLSMYNPIQWKCLIGRRECEFENPGLAAITVRTVWRWGVRQVEDAQFTQSESGRFIKSLSWLLWILRGDISVDNLFQQPERDPPLLTVPVMGRRALSMLVCWYVMLLGARQGFSCRRRGLKTILARPSLGVARCKIADQNAMAKCFCAVSECT